MQNPDQTVVEVLGTVNGKLQALPTHILKEVLLTLLQLEGKIVIVDQIKPADPVPVPPAVTAPAPQPAPEPAKPTGQYSETVRAVLGMWTMFNLPDGHYDLGDLPAGFGWEGRTKTLSAKPEKVGVWSVPMKNETGTVGTLAITVTEDSAAAAPAAEQPAPRPDPAPVEQHQSQAQIPVPLDRNATGIVIRTGTAVAAGQPVTFITIQSDADKNLH